VGQEVLTALVPPVTGLTVRNPMPAAGGADPESVEQVRQVAPQAFRVQQRAVTDQDYADLAARDPSVQRAVGTRRWTGSWYTEYVTVDRRGGAPVDEPFRTALAAVLDGYRMAGGDVEVTAPAFVPVDILLDVRILPGHFRGTVRQALADRFSTRTLPGGGRGFFHPDNFTFAQPVYLSAVVSAAMSVAGVRDVTVRRFQRWGQPASGELAAGQITMDRLEVARCDSEPGDPAGGRADFELAGGL
jgi:predicted phage baseplate assembly protein